MSVSFFKTRLQKCHKWVDLVFIFLHFQSSTSNKSVTMIPHRRTLTMWLLLSLATDGSALVFNIFSESRIFFNISLFLYYLYTFYPSQICVHLNVKDSFAAMALVQLLLRLDIVHQRALLQLLAL